MVMPKFSFLEYDVTNYVYIDKPISLILHFACPASPIDYLKIPIETLKGSKVVAVTNLKPAKMRGIESTAMLLAASNGQGDDETVELLQVPGDVPNGELLNLEGKDPSEPDAMMKSKGAVKAFERAKAGFKANENGEAVWVDEETGTAHKFLTSGGPVKTTSLKDTVIQ